MEHYLHSGHRWRQMIKRSRSIIVPLIVLTSCALAACRVQKNPLAPITSVNELLPDTGIHSSYRVNARYTRYEPQNGDPQFQCVLPYVSGGAEIDVLNSGDEPQNLYALVDLPPHQWGWNIAVPSNSAFKWNEANQEDFVTPLVNGGPISFTSNQPIVAYTVLSSPNTAVVTCSNPLTVKKLFHGDRNSGIVLVNVSDSTIPVLIYEDRNPVYFLTLDPNARRIAFLTDLIRINDDGNHEIMVTTGGAGIGLFALTYKNGLAMSLPLSESN